jgi:phage-related protein
MKTIRSAIPSWIAALTLAALICVPPAGAQSQGMPPQDRDSDMTRQQLATFDRFLDSHPELAEQLRKDPTLVNNEEFVENHRELQQYLQQHPEVREELQHNPNAVLHQEQRYERREDRERDRDRDPNNDVTRGELSNMDRFLDGHPEIAEQLRQNPSLVNDKKFVEGHPALQQFLAQHPGVREEMKENPSPFMAREQRFDQRENMRDRDVTRTELMNMDRFLDSHPEIAEQLRQNPSLVNDKKFVEGHPALEQFLAQHPGVREEYQENPNQFMRQEQSFDRRQGAGMRGNFGMHADQDMNRGEVSSFNEFLEKHNNIATELSKNPSLATNEEYVENHPALRDYLKANPKVREGLNQNPQAFLKSSQGFEVSPKGTPKLPAAEPKLK